MSGWELKPVYKYGLWQSIGLVVLGVAIVIIAVVGYAFLAGGG